MTSFVAESALVAVGLSLAGLLLSTDRQPPLRPEASTNVAITLVSSDATNLDCSLDQPAFGYQCAYDAYGKPRRDRGRGVIVPCVTLHGELLLVPDLFREPAVARRVDADRRLPVSARKRFTVDCHVRVVGDVPNVRVRFKRTARFGQPRSAWLVVPAHCSVAAHGV